LRRALRARAWICAGERCSTKVGERERVEEAGDVDGDLDVDEEVEAVEERWLGRL
jgi:hypothetical protein